MRLALILIALVFVAFGAVFGALNAERVVFDLYFVTWTLPKGAALLAALLVGWFVGGLVVYVGLVPRLRRRVRVLSQEARQREPAATAGTALVPTSPNSDA